MDKNKLTQHQLDRIGYHESEAYLSTDYKTEAQMSDLTYLFALDWYEDTAVIWDGSQVIGVVMVEGIHNGEKRFTVSMEERI